MKSLVFLGLMAVSFNVFASKFEDIKHLSNPKLEAARVQILNLDVITHSNTQKVVELNGKGSTAQKIRERTVAQAMHALCRYFDDGVSIGVNTKDEAGSLAAVTDFTYSLQEMNEQNPEFISLLTATKAMNKESGIEIYSGSASGNNTAGTVLGIYDTKNNELAVFSNTNCGRDD